MGKKELLLAAIVAILFISVSILSLTSIRQLQGNARVVNYIGIVRGATQKLVKKELMEYPDDPLIQRLDSIVDNLLTGEGDNNLIVLHDEQYLALLNQVQAHWSALKDEIYKFRSGSDGLTLFTLSETYFELVNDTVFAAESYSERQVDQSIRFLIGVMIVFALLIIISLVYLLRYLAIQRRAEALGKIAYIDALTQLPNRASCERQIDAIKHRKEMDVEYTAFMFDMNNLKRVNDQKGHQGGDRLIADFASILRQASEHYGYMCRYGGDEFVALFENCNQERAEQFLSGVNERTLSYNLLRIDDLDKISFAWGFIAERLEHMSPEEMINEADRRMYALKRKMKEERLAKND